MDLFLMGDGFDLADGLETTYLDFRDYLEENHHGFLCRLIRPYIHSPLSDNSRDQWHEIFWKDFETNLSKLNLEYFIEAGEEIEPGLEDRDIYGRRHFKTLL